MPGPQPVEGTKVTSVSAASAAPLLQVSGGEIPDQIFKLAMSVCGMAILGILALIVYELVSRSNLSWHAFGFKFFAASDWDPVNERFGALPFIYGTLSFFVELLAAIPSVIYGLWAIFVLVPVLSGYVQPFLARTLGWTGMFEGPPYGIGMLAAGIILAIMIVPIISSITREVLMVVPQHQREGVLALGATRWEMIRMGVLRNARAGILGGIILGLGRALGETMAVTMVIGNRPEIAKSLFAPGYTMASVLANEFSEATGDVYLSALIEIGLALFLVTIIVNALAQLLVWTVTRGQPARGHA
jgi:phosphate transport system permease protein